MARVRPDAFSRAGAAAVQALEALCGAVCGEPPAAVRAWRDGDALLLVLQPGERGLGGLDCGDLPGLVAQAVRARTGCELLDGRHHSDPDMGAELLVFRLPHAARARASAWRRWSPLPLERMARRA
jgi:hypothetical protein